MPARFDEIPTYDQTQRLELSIDGEPIHVFELTPEAPQSGAGLARGENRRALDADWMVKFPAKAGPRTVTLTFLNRTPALLENLLEPFEKPVPGGPNGYYPTQKGAYLRNVEIIGPFTIAGPGDTPSRRRIFVCQPGEGSRRSRLREEDSLNHGPPRVQAAGDGRRHPDAARFL